MSYIGQRSTENGWPARIQSCPREKNINKFVYMVQGKAKAVHRFYHLREREGADAIFLTYDEKIDGAIYYPDSSWAEGRNLLLERASGSGHDYQYYLFLDDDTRFVKGGFELFEKRLLDYRPAVAMPVFVPKTSATILGVGGSCNSDKFVALRRVQICRKGDAQFIAFHRDVISDRLVVPLQTQFDDVSWWFTSSTQQLLIFNLYGSATLQFNEIAVKNEVHGEYPRGDFQHIQSEWLNSQFSRAFVDPRPYAPNMFSSEGMSLLKGDGRSLNFRYLKQFLRTLAGTLTYTRKYSHQIRQRKLNALLQRDSSLLKQRSAARPSHPKPVIG